MQTPPPADEPAPAPPAPPAPPEAPCTNPNPTLCPVVNATYYSYYHKTRYQDGCTFAAGNPGLTLAPAPTSGEVTAVFAPGIAPQTCICTCSMHCAHPSLDVYALRKVGCHVLVSHRNSSCNCHSTLTLYSI